MGGVLFASAAAAIFVGGTILSPYTMQAYAAGGNSKSSFNNIHWDEKSARKWACYATAGQFAAMAGYAAIYGAPGYGISGYVNGSGGAAKGSIGAAKIFNFLSVKDLVLYTSMVLTTKSAIQGDWEAVGLDMAGYASELPVGLAVDYVKGTVRTCEGDL
ncbi:hypothetical protein LEP1GSC087_1223 [Leptospira interrogans serovar Bataviae str. L1111]|nr:hypothetical protein [Leptospira interrogans]EKR26093.1 hypothetical protein LEP1GSC087_1223 [Leptospira interrogans serovar Bataviae str. L1111]